MRCVGANKTLSFEVADSGVLCVKAGTNLGSLMFCCYASEAAVEVIAEPERTTVTIGGVGLLFPMVADCGV